MIKLHTTRTTLALAALALVAACGGGETARTASQDFAAGVSAGTSRSDRLHALGVGGGSTAAAATAVTNAQVFAWAQIEFASLFAGTPSSFTLPYEGKVFDVRAYPNGNFLGIATDGHAYGLGPFTNNVLTDFGLAQSYSAQVCSKVDCGGGTGGGNGTLNECAMPASEVLRTGNSYRAVYANTVFVPTTSTGEYSAEGVVNGPATFEGQSAVQLTLTLKGVQAGTPVDSVVKNFEQAGNNGLTISLGADVGINFGGTNATLHTVFNPGVPNSEFTLQVGQSLTKTTNSTSSYVGLSLPLPPQTASTSITYTYEARETVSVQGRNWDTCRYRETTVGGTDVGYTWYIVGRGLTAKHETRNAGGTVIERTELKSATYNGSAL